MSQFKWGEGVGGRVGRPRPIRRTRGTRVRSGRRKRYTGPGAPSRSPSSAQIRARELFAERSRAGTLRRR